MIFLAGCNKTKTIKQYYDDGKMSSMETVDKEGNRNGIYEEYYRSGKVKETRIYENGKLIDSALVYNEDGSLKEIQYFDVKERIRYAFYEKGKLMATGTLDENEQRIGVWKYYYGEKDFSVKEEFIRLPTGITKMNQQFFYDNGKLNKDKSRFFHISFPDTISVGVEKMGEIEYNFIAEDANSVKLGKNQFIFMSYFDDVDDSFNDLSQVIKDTVTPWEEGEIRFVKKFNKGGLRFLKGIIEENLYMVGKDSTTQTISRMYFKHPVFVKE